MANNKFITAQEAAALVKDGDFVKIGRAHV